MIEVEKQCQPSETQLKALLADATFLKEKIDHDIYYDYADYRLFKEDVRLRERNGSFELKVGESSGVSKEIEKKKDIEKYFGIDNLEEFIKNNLIPFIDYKSKRQKYKKGDFNISIDEMNFGYKVCEIELLVEEENIKDAEDKINNLAKQYSIELKIMHSKRQEYFRLFKPDVYKELCL